jgi:hypothetical protein
VSVGVDGQFAVVVYGLAFRTMVRIRPRRRSDFRRCSACLVGGFGSSASFDRFFGNERSLGFLFMQGYIMWVGEGEGTRERTHNRKKKFEKTPIDLFVRFIFC